MDKFWLTLYPYLSYINNKANFNKIKLYNI